MEGGYFVVGGVKVLSKNYERCQPTVMEDEDESEPLPNNLFFRMVRFGNRRRLSKLAEKQTTLQLASERFTKGRKLETDMPTVFACPSDVSGDQPTYAPTSNIFTNYPTSSNDGGTDNPTDKPTRAPTARPGTKRPTRPPRPTKAPTAQPRPTRPPSPKPTSKPTRRPTSSPSASPTISKAPTIPGEWEQVFSVRGEETGDHAGQATTMTPDKKFLVVGSPYYDSERGMVRVYRVVNGELELMGRKTDLEGEDDGEQYGRAIAISDDAKVLFVGSPYANDGKGMVTVYRYNEDNDKWKLLGGTITGSRNDDNFGASLATNEDGSRVVIGAPMFDGDRPGYMEAYQWNIFNGNWLQLGDRLQGLNDGDLFGYDVDFNKDGDVVAIGIPGSDATVEDFQDESYAQGYVRRLSPDRKDVGRVQIYGLKNSNWFQLGQDLVGDSRLAEAGISVALNSDGTRLAYGIPGLSVGEDLEAGVVRVMIYYETIDKWAQLGEDITGEFEAARIGQAVALDSAGHTVGYYSGPTDVLLGQGGQGGTITLKSWDGFEWQNYGPPLEIEEAGATYFHVDMNGDGFCALVGFHNANGRGFTKVFRLEETDPAGTPSPKGPYDQERLLTCIAVIDENDGENINSKWREFRDEFPDRKFCLLRPEFPKGDLFIPNAFGADGNTIFDRVNRDNGNLDDASDWYELCDLDADKRLGLTNVGVFVDASGSLALDAVQASVDLFVDKVNANGFKIAQGTYNRDENYINPCMTTTTLTAEPTPTPTASPSEVPSGMPSETPSMGPTEEYGWSLTAQVKGDEVDDMLGRGLSYSCDGNYMAVGSPGFDDHRGRVEVLTLETKDKWVRVGNILDGNYRSASYGQAVALATGGPKMRLFVGSPGYDDNGTRNTGRVDAYELRDDMWRRLGGQMIGNRARGNSGYSVASSADGNVVAFGTPTYNDERPGFVTIYKYQSTNDIWVELGTSVRGTQANDFCGSSIALSDDGYTLLVGCPGRNANGDKSGQVIFYRYDESRNFWDPLGDNTVDGQVEDDAAGTSISASSDGLTVAVGIPGMSSGGYVNNGAVQIYTYKNSTSLWTQVGTDIIGYGRDHEIGATVSLASDGDVVAYDAGPYMIANEVIGSVVNVYAFDGIDWAPYGPSRIIEHESSYLNIDIGCDGTHFAIGYENDNGRGFGGSYQQVGFSAPTPAPTLNDRKQNEKLTCISVIDENNGRNVNILWGKLRDKFPDRPFCLLQPVPAGGDGGLSLPLDFYTEENENIHSEVTRRPEEETNPSDWYDICDMDASKARGITKVALFIDNSGSMITSHVQTSYDLFVEKLEERGFEIVVGVQNDKEDYITPCLTAEIE